METPYGGLNGFNKGLGYILSSSKGRKVARSISASTLFSLFASTPQQELPAIP